MPGIPTFTSSSYLSLPPTTAAFWQYISSPLLTHSLQTVFSASSNPTNRFTVSSIITSFAQFQHVIGSIMSASDLAAMEFFEWVLTDQFNLTADKIDARYLGMRDAMKEGLRALVEEHSRLQRKGFLHPAIIEAREILTEMEFEDEDEESSSPLPRPLSTLTAAAPTFGKPKQSVFLDVEEYTLRNEFVAFKRDTPGPNGRTMNASTRPVCPSLIMSLRIYHDGLLSVDSKHAFQPTASRPGSSSLHRGRDSLQQQLRNKRFPSSVVVMTDSISSQRNPSLSFLERQFLEAMQIRPLARTRPHVEHDIELSRLLEAYNPNYDASIHSNNSSGGEKSDAVSVSVSPKSRSGSVVSTAAPPTATTGITSSYPNPNSNLTVPPQSTFPSPSPSPSHPHSHTPQSQHQPFIFMTTPPPPARSPSERSEASTIGKIVRKNSHYTWKGDWDTEDEEEFYREVLRYNPVR